jgi:glycogen debranching enzyme
MNTVSATKLANDALRLCATDIGFVAGPHHFVDLWARDSLFATFGSTAIGKYAWTKKTIETFLRFQRKDGLIPYRVMRSRSTIRKYFGKPTYISKPVANFHSHQSGFIVPDGGLLTIIATALYSDASKDQVFLKKHYASLALAMAWYEKRNSGGLIKEGFLCEWADAVLKIGSTLYTNVLYVKALEDMSRIAKTLGFQKESVVYKKRYEDVLALVRKTLWNGTYFSDWFDYKRQDYFSSHANFLAIFFGLIDQKESLEILDYAKQHTVSTFTVETNHPRYPFWRIPLVQFLAGVRDYHNRGCMWLQPGIWYTMCLWKTGKKAEARTFLSRIAAQITKHEMVYEVYEKSGDPVKRRIYRSEGPFAWSAGLFLYACNKIGITRKVF